MDDLHVMRHFRDEMGRVEVRQLSLSQAAGHYGHVIDVRVLDHCSDCACRAPGVEIVPDVLLRHAGPRSPERLEPIGYSSCLLD